MTLDSSSTIPKTPIMFKRFDISVSHRGLGYNLSICLGFSGPEDEETGLIRDLSQIKKELQDAVINQYDHVDLDYACSEHLFLPELMNRIYEDVERFYKNEAESKSEAESEAAPLELTAISVSEMVGVTYLRYLTGDVYILCPMTQRSGVNVLDLQLCFHYQANQTIVPVPQLHSILTDSSSSLSSFSLSSFSLESSSKILAELYEQVHALPHLHAVGVSQSEWGIFYSPQECRVRYGAPFQATHALRQSRFTEDKNLRLYGPCSRVHGHQFRLSATSCTQDPEHVGQLFTQLKEAIDHGVNHCHKQDLLTLFEEEKRAVMSCENVLLALSKRYQDTDYPLLSLCLKETFNNVFMLCRDGHPYEGLYS